MTTLKVLSIRQPWTSLIAQGYKDIENRGWKTSYRGAIALHASKTVEQIPRSHLVPILGLEASHTFYTASWDTSSWPTGGVIAVAQLVDIVTESDSPWFSGPYGWVLRDIRPVPFYPLTGRLWLFDAPEALITHCKP